MRKEFERFLNLMEFLSLTLGETFGAGIFDLSDPERPLIGTANSHKKVQEKVRTFIEEATDSKMAQANGYLVNQPLTVDTKLLKLSIYFIRDDEGAVIGAFWLSMNCDVFMKMSALVETMMCFSHEDMNSEEIEAKKSIRREPSLDCITEVIKEFGVESGRATLSERQEIICDLYDTGVFEIKGSVAKTAEALGISEQTVYRYITKIKKARGW